MPLRALRPQTFVHVCVAMRTVEKDIMPLRALRHLNDSQIATAILVRGERHHALAGIATCIGVAIQQARAQRVEKDIMPLRALRRAVIA